MERRLSVSVDLQRNRKTLNHSQQHVIITHKEIMMQTSMSVRKCSSEHRMGGTDKTPFITAVLRVFTGFSDYTLALSPSPPRNCLKRSNFFSLQRSQSHWHQLTHTRSACQSSVAGCEHAALWLRFLCGLYNSCVYVCVCICVCVYELVLATKSSDSLPPIFAGNTKDSTVRTKLCRFDWQRWMWN